MNDDKPKLSGKPFEKGRSGNPGGRPRIEKHLRELLGDDLDAIAMAMGSVARGVAPAGSGIRSVSAGDAVRAAEWVYDRCYGKPKQNVKIESDSRVLDANAFDPAAMSTEDLRNALGAIATLKRIGGVVDEPADDAGTTEH